MRIIFLTICLLLAACAHQSETARSSCAASLETRIADELRIIDAGERIDATTEEVARTPDQQHAVEQADALMNSHSRPVDAHDLAILDRAGAILSGDNVWDRADDRICQPQDTKFSLYCALQKASMDVLGEYQHRRASLQEVRFAVDEVTGNRPYEHRLRDYNNDRTTKLADIHAVITVARLRVAARLGSQCSNQLRSPVGSP